jgi:hypothetical protein
MSVFDTLDLVLHKIKVKLYPNYLPGIKGAYIARTDNEKTLDIKDICTTLVTRGGSKRDINEIMEIVKEYNGEVVYQINDGYAVSNGYYVVRLNVGGTFDSENEAHDRQKHPITCRFSALKRLNDILKRVSVEVEGLADTGGYIDEFIDTEENLVNSQFIPEHMFVIHGHKIKVEGDVRACGVFLVPVDNPNDRLKVERLSENTPSKVTGILPPSTGNKINRIEIITQYSGTEGTPLKSRRTIVSPFTLEEV